MDQQGTARAGQESRQQDSENASRTQRNQQSSSGESQGGLARQNRGTESSGFERRSQGRSGYYPSIFSVSPGEFFTMSPITLMRRFTEDIDRAFGFGGNRSMAGFSGEELEWTPRIEVMQSGNNLVVHAELPGLSENEVRVEATDQGLLIEGERQRRQEKNEKGWHHSEFSYGRFSRLIPLPESAKIEQARANFRNGVLEVSVPVSEEESRRRQIPISTEEKQGSQQASGSSKEGTTRAASAGR